MSATGTSRVTPSSAPATTSSVPGPSSTATSDAVGPTVVDADPSPSTSDFADVRSQQTDLAEDIFQIDYHTWENIDNISDPKHPVYNDPNCYLMQMPLHELQELFVDIFDMPNIRPENPSWNQLYRNSGSSTGRIQQRRGRRIGRPRTFMAINGGDNSDSEDRPLYLPFPGREDDSGSSGEEWCMCVEDVETGEVGILHYNLEDKCDEFIVCDHESPERGECWLVRRRMRGRSFVRRRRGRSKGKDTGGKSRGRSKSKGSSKGKRKGRLP